ncbi:MAG TPA: condensation domain-containing protein, partial [Pyrinomonadaceae bacterium]
MSKVNTEDIYRLSPMQEGMLFHTISDPKSRVYFQQESYTIGSGLNVDALRRAWQQVVDRHPILRTGFVWERREKPLQIVYKSVSLPWEQLDWRGFKPSEQAERLNAYLEQDRAQGFNLSRPTQLRLTLIQMGEEQYSFIWRFHHVLMDQWSVSLLFKEVFTLYGALCQGRPLALERPKPYRDYIAWLRRQDLSKAETFWRDALRGFTTPTPLKSKGAGGSLSEREPEYTKQKIKLSAATTAALQAAARKQQLTLNTIVQGAWALLLSRYSGEKDVVFGTSISGRPAELAGADSMIGLFINTLPARVQVNQDAVFVDWLKEFQYRQMTARQYLYSPLVQIQAWSEVPGGQPLFESLLVFENAPREDHLSGGGAPFQIKPGASFDQSQYPLTLVVWPGPELSMEIWSNSRDFDSTTIARILKQWQLVLEGFVADPTQRLSNLSLLTEEERQQLLLPLHSAPADFPSHRCLHHLFEDQVRRNPLAIALAHEQRSLSYLDLNRRANQLARFLISHHHIGHGSLVAICLHHSFETFVALLAVLKTGAAYVPFDPLHPPARLAFMLEDSNAALLLTEQALQERFHNTATPLMTLDTEWQSVSSESDADLALDLTSDALAYVIYTSGSTGQPKGVAITNRSLVNYVWWAKDVYVRGESLSFALYSSLAFDLTVTSLYVPLVSGGRVEIYVADGGESALLKVLEADAADVVKATPSHLALMKEAARGKSRIKRLIVGGEALRTELAREVTEALGGEVEIYNEYGPTEATVGCTAHLYDVERDQREDVPIGRAGANMH